MEIHWAASYASCVKLVTSFFRPNHGLTVTLSAPEHFSLGIFGNFSCDQGVYCVFQCLSWPKIFTQLARVWVPF